MKPLLILAALYLAHRAYRSHARRVDRAWRADFDMGGLFV